MRSKAVPLSTLTLVHILLLTKNSSQGLDISIIHDKIHNHKYFSIMSLFPSYTSCAVGILILATVIFGMQVIVASAGH